MVFLNLARRLLVGSEQRFVFNRPLDNQTLSIPPQFKTLSIYIHLPFCKSLCPYCPYNRVLYNNKLTSIYTKALLKEIELCKKIYEDTDISSIYIGGGTPTVMINELEVILKAIRKNFSVNGDICIETNPSELSPETLTKLIESGIDLLSIGMQSFNNKFLRQLGRGYDAETAGKTVRQAVSRGFKSVNLDLMFALPGQKEKDIVDDLEKAVSYGVDQITAYPLFTFPYSSAGRFLQIRRVRMPNFSKRRKMYHLVHDFLINKGFQRVSVWGFKKGNSPKYSSVTRDNYIGLGAGAGSKLPGVFYFNTFSVPEYIDAVRVNKSPMALSMNIGAELEKYYWFYWRLYETNIKKQDLNTVFGQKDKKIQTILWIMKVLTLCTEEEDIISLTRRGSFYIHLLQNYFVLNYINNVWTVAMQTPWPEEIRI